MAKVEGNRATEATSIRQRRKSSFKELDLDTMVDTQPKAPNERPRRRVRFQSQSDVFEASDNESPPLSAHDLPSPRGRRSPDYTVSLKTPPLPRPRQTASSSFVRLFPVVVFAAIALALLHNSPLIGQAGSPQMGVAGGVIQTSREELAQRKWEKRQQYDPTNYCTRFSHQSALVNGTLYVYGGQATQSPGQTTNTWNNDFLTIPLNATWQISTPTMNALPQPSGPPAVANAYLWNSYDSLFLYGGEYSDSPATSPAPYAMWEYNIPSATWTEHSAPQTLPGVSSDGGGNPVQEAAEGAGISVTEFGKGYYFSGHLDGYTTAGWSQSIERVYLKSMIEFTFPGYPNDAITTLSGGQPAGNDGAWRNITQGGLQLDAFSVRADGVLVYIPGYSAQGIIIALGGGTNDTFNQFNLIDVFDIASSTWYKQSTSGPTPLFRVNACAVAASAPDGSSTQVYLYGGQNLVPFAQQVQYGDMYILTIPSFTWITVDTSNQAVPPARAGHTCNIWDGQMIVVGGFNTNLSCDSPGVYVFDASKLQWQNQFTALSGGDAQNQQAAQSQNASGLSGSFGYQVPDAVQSVIGGGPTGGATVTAPVETATGGPLATGKPIIYTVTGSNGATVTETGAPGSGGSGSGSGTTTSDKKSGPNVAAIAAGVVAGVFFIVACYLGFCTWVYRRQLQLYKNHVAMSQRAAAAGAPNEKQNMVVPRSSEDPSSNQGKRSTDRSSAPSGVGSGAGSNANSGGRVPPMPAAVQAPLGGNSTANSSTEDLMVGQEPSFVGVLLNPRRSLRVINRD